MPTGTAASRRHASVIPGTRKYDLSPWHSDVFWRHLLPQHRLMNQTILTAGVSLFYLWGE